jgi:hypothetical protein
MTAYEAFFSRTTSTIAEDIFNAEINKAVDYWKIIQRIFPDDPLGVSTLKNAASVGATSLIVTGS